MVTIFFQLITNIYKWQSLYSVSINDYLEKSAV